MHVSHASQGGNKMVQIVPFSNKKFQSLIDFCLFDSYKLKFSYLNVQNGFIWAQAACFYPTGSEGLSQLKLF